MQTNGAAIRAIREAKGWNLNPFASHAGIDSGYLSRLERGQHNASPRVLKQIATTLCVPLAAITSNENVES